MKFIGHKEQKSILAIIGAPWESKEVFRPGVSKAPQKIREASDSIEEYSVFSQAKLPSFNDYGDIPLDNCTPEKMIERAGDIISELIENEHRILLIGGDHTVSYPSILSHSKYYPNLKIIHLDAHTDRYKEYLGSKYAYATVIHNVSEIVGNENIYSFGIREMGDIEETSDANIFNFEVVKFLHDLLDKINDYPIYLTFDCDVLSPSIFPGVTNPVPSGISFNEILRVFKILSPYIVGADIVECNPLVDKSGNSEIMASIIVRELLINWGKFADIT